LILVFFKAKRIQHKVYTIAMILLIVFFYTTGSKVIADNNLNIQTFEGLVTAGRLYLNWLGHVFTNTKTVLGNALKMDWTGNTTIK